MLRLLLWTTDVLQHLYRKTTAFEYCMLKRSLGFGGEFFSVQWNVEITINATTFCC